MAVVPEQQALTPSLRPLCSVCIANYNGESMLADCLDSVFRQSGDVALEVIVHDDASTDASLATLARYPEVIVLASRENVGFCIANNRMVERARGEYILLLNNDAALYPDALKTLLRAAARQTSQGILTLPQYDWQTGVLVDRGCLLDPFYNPVPNLDPQREDVAMVIGACLFLSRHLWINLGGFPEWMESIAEDMYLCCGARLRGAPIQVTSSSGYRHRQGASFSGDRDASELLQTTFRRRRLSERNKTAVMVVCTPSVLVGPLLALHILALSIEGLVMSILRKDKRIWLTIYASAMQSIFRHASELRDRRAALQMKRKVGLRTYFRVFVWIPQKLHLLRRHGIPLVR